MKLDNETQKKFLLELFGQVNFPGALLELAYGVRTAIFTAKIDNEDRLHNALILLRKWPSVSAGMVNEHEAQELMDATAALLETFDK